MKGKMQSTISSLISHLEYLKSGEIEEEDFIAKEKEILNKINVIVEETNFNGANLLSGNETVSLFIAANTNSIQESTEL